VSVPAGPGVVERGEGEYFPGGCWVTGFWGLKEWVAPSASERGFAARMGVKRPEMGSKRRFLGAICYVAHNGATPFEEYIYV